ncbi:hypothetical protein GCM10027614_50880 [Micromonospora vulcania]
MKHYDAETEDLISRVRPTAEVTFTTSPQGEAILARLLELPQQPEKSFRKRRLGVVGAVAAATLAAGGATAAIGGYHAPNAPPEAMPANDMAFVCATSGMHRMGKRLRELARLRSMHAGGRGAGSLASRHHPTCMPAFNVSRRFL